MKFFKSIFLYFPGYYLIAFFTMALSAALGGVSEPFENYGGISLPPA
jgi:hypothetical protein